MKKEILIPLLLLIIIIPLSFFVIGTKKNQNEPSLISTVKEETFKNIGGGSGHFFAIKEDGTLWGWGAHSFGQLGLGLLTEAQKYIDISQIGKDSDWKFIAAGGIHTLAIKEDGSLWGWGDDRFGQLGLDSNPETNHYKSPQKITRFTDWVFLEAGRIHSFGLREDGSLWGWGYNEKGQLGLGDKINRITPDKINSVNNWAMVTGGDFHTIGIQEDGSLWGWGDLEGEK